MGWSATEDGKFFYRQQRASTQQENEGQRTVVAEEGKESSVLHN
jgi:hypothetical protein